MAKLVLIDGEGVADLSDGTHWQIAYVPPAVSETPD